MFGYNKFKIQDQIIRELTSGRCIISSYNFICDHFTYSLDKKAQGEVAHFVFKLRARISVISRWL